MISIAKIINSLLCYVFSDHPPCINISILWILCRIDLVARVAELIAVDLFKGFNEITHQFSSYEC